MHQSCCRRFHRTHREFRDLNPKSRSPWSPPRPLLDSDVSVATPKRSLTQAPCYRHLWSYHQNQRSDSHRWRYSSRSIPRYQSPRIRRALHRHQCRFPSRPPRPPHCRQRHPSYLYCRRRCLHRRSCPTQPYRRHFRPRCQTYRQCCCWRSPRPDTTRAGRPSSLKPGPGSLTKGSTG